MAKAEITDLESLWKAVARANGWKRPDGKRPPVYTVMGGGSFETKSSIMVSQYVDGGTDPDGNPAQGGYRDYKSISGMQAKGTIPVEKTPMYALPILFDYTVNGNRFRIEWGIEQEETFDGRGNRKLTPKVVQRFIIGDGDQRNKTVDWMDEHLWMALEMSPWCAESPIHWNQERKSDTGIAVTMSGDAKAPVFSCLHHADAKAEAVRREVSADRAQCIEVVAKTKDEGVHVFYEFCNALGVEAPDGPNRVWDLFDSCVKLCDTEEGRKKVVVQALLGDHDVKGTHDRAVDRGVVVFKDNVWRFDVDGGSPIEGADGEGGLLKAMKASPMLHWRIAFLTRKADSIRAAMAHADTDEARELILRVQKLVEDGKLRVNPANSWVNHENVTVVWAGKANTQEGRMRVLEGHVMKKIKEKGAEGVERWLTEITGPVATSMR